MGCEGMTAEDILGMLNELVDTLQMEHPATGEALAYWRLARKGIYQRMRQALAQVCAERDAAVGALADLRGWAADYEVTQAGSSEVLGVRRAMRHLDHTLAEESTAPREDVTP